MADPASATTPSVDAQSAVAGRVAELRDRAASTPIEARDEAWRWFVQLGEEVGRDREQGMAALAELFSLGIPPAGIDRRTEGILVAPLIATPVDRVMRAIEGLVGRPWPGKRFDAGANPAGNRPATEAPSPPKSVRPASLPRA